MNKRQVYPGDYIHKDRRSVVDLRSYLDQKMFGVVTTPNVYTVFLYKEAGFLKFDEEWHIESKGSFVFFSFCFLLCHFTRMFGAFLLLYPFDFFTLFIHTHYILSF
ncbi:hypothetical protein YC2023_023726 [Brassica napus]|uniref:(rape) hypothetical protein n=1 Tax=Brassica napus TaxID=3708 RepID=A0A816X1A3_BRANA|nr:unnamed protein product [Brassica napus]